MELLQSHIRGYTFNMKAWVESLEYLYDWLVDKDRYTTFEEALSFLTSCAELASECEPPRALLPVVKETLDDFGFEDI
ncbi:MAG TPA: hypothetical protein DIU37_04000 [Opitutae bacterium]|nr:hypothetical protein [Opitutae bacterium]